MPLYDYLCETPKCAKSKKVLSFIVPLERYDETIKCPECKKPLRRMLSAPMFRIGS
jgi:putative FmdB family regulatory protein